MTDEDIANMSNNFTLPARLAKKAADWQKSQKQRQAQKSSQQDSEYREYSRPSKQ